MKNEHVLCGASSFKYVNNFGDQLIKDIFISWASEVDAESSCTLIEYSGVSRFDKEVKRPLRDARKLIFIGGGYLGEPSYATYSRIESIGRKMVWGFRNHFLYGRAAQFARKAGIPYAVFGVEFGPITNPVFRRSAKALLSNAASASLRTQESIDFAKKYGVNGDVELVPDVVLTLRRNHLPKNSRYGPPKSERRKRIGLHIHDNNMLLHFPRFSDLIDELIDQMGGAENLQIFYIHDQDFQGNPKERATLAEQFFVRKYESALVHDYSTHWDLVDFISTLDLVVTTKLHVGILARALDVPVISIPSHHKTPRFYRLIDEESRVFDLGSADSELTDKLEGIVKEIAIGKSPIKEIVRRDATRNKEMLLKFLETDA
jgi:polysaccharide pyruvyl transferase WcaK-like protein